MAPDGSWDFGPSCDDAPGYASSSPSAAALRQPAPAASASTAQQATPQQGVPRQNTAPSCALHGRGDDTPAASPLLGSTPPASGYWDHYAPSDGHGTHRRMHRERHSSGSGSHHHSSGSGHGSSSHGGSGRPSLDGGSSADGGGASAGQQNSCVPLVVAPVLARMLGVHQDRQVQKALAQLKLAFDNLEKLKPGTSRDVITQMFELVVSSKNPSVSALMPPSVAALASLTSELSMQQQQQPPAPPPQGGS